ncbi:two-component regulator propeller domain-containing protein [Saccharicrinis sp. FJH2]|uniref:two-component regulator propeller domain-containing protein n=1 Tax=Saccharicrinis sp. FJH65 TaxID=3344659 RepID=UPI0035F484DC
MQIQRIIVTFLGIFFTITSSVAQDISFKHITDKEGLYYNWIWDIFKDSEGFMWFCSQEGAFRYDGNEFETFVFKSSSGISNVNINCISEDNNSNIWFGTNEGLIQYQRKTNKFQRYFLDSLGSNSSNLINAITEDNKGYLWIATGDGLFSYNQTKKTFKRYFSDARNNSLNTNVLNALLFDSKNQLWIGGNDGSLYMYVPLNDHFINFRNQQNKNYTGINVIYEDHQGYLWVGYNGFGASKFNSWTKEYVRNIQNTNKPNQIVNNYVRGIVENNDHTIWFGTENGLSVLDQDKDKFTTVKSEFEYHNGLNDNAIYCLYKEQNGDIWIGTFFGGVNVFYNRPEFIHTFQPDGSKNNISGNAVGPIIKDGNNLWIGTEDNGVNKFNQPKRIFEHYSHNNSNLSYDNVHSLCMDHLGNLWVGTFTGGLNLLAKGSADFVHFVNSDDPQSISNNSIYALVNDSFQNLWVGTRGGLNRFNYANKTFERIHENILGGKFIWDIKEDKDGNIWLCTFENGVYFLDRKNNYAPNHIDLPVNRTVTLIITTSNTVLIGTEKQGLIVYYPDSRTYKHLTTAENKIPDNTIYGIIEDNSNTIWFTTNKGLCKTKDFNKIETFTTHDGLPTNRFNYNSAAKFNGKLYFGSTQGLVVINPDLQTTEVMQPLLHITSIEFPNRKDNFPEMGESIDHIDKLELNHNFSSFSIKYVGINFRESNKIKYAIKMDGIDDTWNYVGDSKIANYNNLVPGTYTFRVRTVDKFGELQNYEKSLNITIIPPWWGTFLAKVIFIFVGVSIVFFILYLLFLRTKVKHALEIEKLEKLKIKDINDAKIKFFTNISHELKTPLTLIKGPVNRLINDKSLTNKQLVWYHNLIKKNTERLLHLINELLEFKNVDNDHLDIRLENVNINEVIEDICENYFWLAETNKINFTVNIEDAVSYICLDAVKLEKILNNLLLNAFGNTPENGYISIEVYLNDDFLKILVKNSGSGLSPEKITRIFDRDFTQNKYNELNKGTGIGLAYTKTLVELHQGTINVFSLENVETSFIVKIPTNLDKTFSLEEHKNESVPGYNPSLDIDLDPTYPIFDENIKPKILIVEDVKELRDFICDALENKFTLLTASNGLDAYKLAQSENPELIVSDVMMPKLNGYELCSKIKNTFTTSHIRIILLTVLSDDTNKLIGYKAGADAYLSKPFDIELLISRINNLLKDSYVLKQKFQKDLNITPKEITFSNPDEELLQVIINTVNEHLNDSEFDVDKFAKEIGLSKSTLYRKMKSITGLSTNEFVQILRLKKAAQLLNETQMSISEIAYETGFSDPYYFSRAFKKNFNVSPKKYRESIISQN